jgi:hypothetical protein
MYKTICCAGISSFVVIIMVEHRVEFVKHIELKRGGDALGNERGIFH